MVAVLAPEAGASVLAAGGLVLYPTEAVWGLGCDPFNADAVARLLALKQREPGKGLILIADSLERFNGLLDLAAVPGSVRSQVLSSWPGPHTWVVPCGDGVPPLVRGDHAGVAVRISAHPVAAALCRAFGGPIVSTSANLSGAPAVRARAELDATLLAAVDAIIEGETGGLASATPIRDALTGAVLRQ